MQPPVNDTPITLTLDREKLLGLARRFGTPLFVYDGDSIRARASRFAHELGDRVDVHFSVKANPSLAILALMRSVGLGAEIASLGELVAAQRAGFDPDRIIFAGPGKTDEEIEAAIGSGIAQINAESERELERIEKAARARETIQRVGIRVNPDWSSGDGLIRTSGGTQKFGIDRARLESAIVLVDALGSLKLSGLHVMLGSQVLDEEAMLAHCRAGIELAQEINSALDEPLDSINLGGGLGAPHVDDDLSFDLVRFARSLMTMIDRSELGSTRVVLEPGRALVSELGVCLMSVVDTKESNGEPVVILDGGINHALLPITSNTYTMRRIEVEDDHEGSSALVGGALCTSADQWRPQAPLSGARVGEVVAMYNAGAYALSASMTMFLSRGVPGEVLVLDRDAHLVRERSRPEDVLEAQSIPNGISDS